MRWVLCLVLFSSGIAAAAPASPAELIKQASEQEQKGDWPAARATHAKLATIHDYEAQGLYGAAWDAFNAKDFPATATLAAKAGDYAGPYRVRAQILVGDSHYQRGEFERAKATYSAITTTDANEQATIDQKLRMCRAKLAPVHQ